MTRGRSCRERTCVHTSVDSESLSSGGRQVPNPRSHQPEWGSSVPSRFPPNDCHVPCPFTHSRTHSHSRTLPQTYTLTQSHTHSHSRTLSHTLTHSLTLTQTRTPPKTYTHTQSRTHTLGHSYKHTQTHSYPLTLWQTPTDSHSHSHTHLQSCSHSLVLHTHTVSYPLTLSDTPTNSHRYIHIPTRPHSHPRALPQTHTHVLVLEHTFIPTHTCSHTLTHTHYFLQFMSKRVTWGHGTLAREDLYGSRSLKDLMVLVTVLWRSSFEEGQSPFFCRGVDPPLDRRLYVKTRSGTEGLVSPRVSEVFFLSRHGGHWTLLLL